MKILKTIGLLIITATVNAQNYNLVSNSSFEYVPSYNFNIWDTVMSQNYCWVRANGSPIFFRIGGNQITDSREFVARSGRATLALLCSTPPYVISTNTFFDTNFYSQFRFYGQTYLSKPLQSGKQYYLTMYIGDIHFSIQQHHSNFHLGFLRNIGVYFSNTQLKDYNNLNRINVTPHLNFTNWTPAKTDTFEYIKLTGVYTAQGGEQYLTIGNFDYYANFYLKEWDSSSLSYSTQDTLASLGVFTYIDDISLVSDTTQPMISLAHFSLGNDTIICPNDTLTLGGEPYFFHYWWSNGDTTRFTKITQPGTYWCTVDFGCSTYTDTINISPPKTIQPFDIKDTALCYIDYIQRAPPGYNSYLWSDNSITDSLHITAPGSYWVKVDNGCGQYYTDTFTITIADTTKPPSPLPDVFLCNANGETVTAASGFESYLWSTGDTTQSILITQSGTYTLEAVNNCGAIYRDTFHVFDAITSINLGNDTMVCNAAMTLALSIPSSLSNILWSNGATTNSIIVNTPGTYYVTATSPCGILSDTIHITFCQPEIENLNLSSQVICVGECITVTAQSINHPQTWLWSFDGGTPSAFNGQNPTPICYHTIGNYNISLIASNAGGSDTFTSSINVLPIPQGRFDDTTINVPYKTLLYLQACAEGQHVYWYRGDSVVCNDCPVYSFEAKDWQRTYYCIVENAEGICSDTCIYKVSVYDIPTDVYLPTAFSPNGDGLNETFKVLTDNPNFQMHSLSVYNRWGQRIYYGTNDKGGWDGTYKGVKVEVGVYFWSLKYRILGVDKDFFYMKGDVTVVR